jgi:hypothetical protein
MDVASVKHYLSLTDECTVEMRQEMTNKELSHLKEQGFVKKALESSSWACLAAAINEKRSRMSNNLSHSTKYVGWAGYRPEKEADEGKFVRIETNQRKELDSLKSVSISISLHIRLCKFPRNTSSNVCSIVHILRLTVVHLGI